MKLQTLLNLSLLVGSLAAGGCHSRLLDHSNDPVNPKENPVIVGGTDLAGACPDIGMETPLGFTRQSFYVVLHNTNEVKITNEPTATVFVLLRDVETWFKLGDHYSGAYWYERLVADTITYHGSYLEGKEVCVYEYIPKN
jgi:hypothetical protein